MLWYTELQEKIRWQTNKHSRCEDTVNSEIAQYIIRDNFKGGCSIKKKLSSLFPVGTGVA
jgi:hypothetical protein